ncbi:MAG: UDP-N-acetylmuramate:L-alanyl-gamma-D-glutamyl-meso-diaminopimelate ligase [Gammaproteobacteria bacterium]|nr:UDP-N-acetylmuramate:L-alanyl-gamma-D-glutamyl-meso-diaminopimelate ligase [Gammaproteobacteria bacterium]NIM72781.1 UDP-N-acetylmuramate:L-alanyl-gamma-D-glutamyl-meso-diaminopimelate ligase [Gammaproteobacteria bacterium]NIN38238.1 UDP-N-acetylmuramate:L-alanyl-gamma-D-glutamyl-meso-diaminopimelate ligase [Gammaproteobacteria bacterium]NIO24529.1 UDP-N-acetylmuramate:L-alanyl-gamma-D-glutamyl-meso-diaminopimelate ligase [Gammaproteobacteria bacterium]NIO65138.1 UDP-N-acetylmuramate:L-alany
MRIHILGICGTFMAGIARLARELGFSVTGSDANAYPPMSEQLAALGIDVMEGYDPAHLDPVPDCVVIGNAMTRGNPAVEHVLDHALPFTSGPAWLAEHVLAGRWVLAVAGTHGKTTGASMLAWILEHAGLAPGFLIGGVPENFGVSSRMGERYFVVEADEYDSAFFDKRSKFVHYLPRTLVVNNLEFDHADIFEDLAAISRQFHHLVRTVPSNGRILRPIPDAEIDRLMDMGCWTPLETFTTSAASADWRANMTSADGATFEVARSGVTLGSVSWPLIGRHNVCNALAAIGAAAHAGVDPADACAALATFRNVKRRLEVRGMIDGVTVYDDFAHHPTAIGATLAALRSHIGAGRIIAVLDPASNTMRSGAHKDTLGAALAAADTAWIYRSPSIAWNIETLEQTPGADIRLRDDVEALVHAVSEQATSDDHVLVMSNSGFQGFHQRLMNALSERHR